MVRLAESRWSIQIFLPCFKLWEQWFHFIRSVPSVCIDQNRHGMRRLTQIRVDFSDLRDHRFNHNFNCPSPTCSCGIEDETTSHFLLCCPRYNTPRQAYLSKISEITNSDVSILPKDHLTDLLLYGSKAYNTITNELILTETILFIYRSERFKHLEAFSWIFSYLNACHLARGPLVQTLWTFIRQLFVFSALIL